MSRPVRTICLTGPESTGKTTLAERLARHMGVAWVPEAARLYAERVARELTADDVEPIAHEEIALLDAGHARTRATGSSLLVLDTDLMSTMIYGAWYYGFHSDFIECEARARMASLYFLCDVDFPWRADGIRDRPQERDAMFESFRATLASWNAVTVPLRGTVEERWTTMLQSL